jgi:hypothetical protein
VFRVLRNREFGEGWISQLVAALLLIAIVVTTSILLYDYSAGFSGGLGTGMGQQRSEDVVLEVYN